VSVHLETTQRGQCVKGFNRAVIGLQRLCQHGALAGNTSRVQASAGASAVVQRNAAQARQQQRRHRGVADAHFAQQQRIAGQAAHDFHAVGQRLGALRCRHGGAGGCVLRARRHLAQQQPGLAGLGRARGKVARHAAVHHRERQSMLAGQHAHGGATGQKVFDHLPGHVARVSRNAARGQAMVACKDEHLRLLQPGRFGAQDLPQLERQVFKAPERAQRLGFVVQLVLQGLGEQRIGEVGKSGQVDAHGVFNFQKGLSGASNRA
jgi:hypothetical protein